MVASFTAPGLYRRSRTGPPKDEEEGEGPEINPHLIGGTLCYLIVCLLTAIPV